jgi:FtsP/CotA-like multicopper oxidase with cupredoxin domain
MPEHIDRRRFLGLGMTGLAGAMALGLQAPRVAGLAGSSAFASPAVRTLRITDAMVEMVDLRRVYMWTFADALGARQPGPRLSFTEGDDVELEIENALDQPHAFAVAGTGISSGAIAPGDTAHVSFRAPAPGTYIYLDPLAAPLNRLMGLHGVMVVLPKDGPTPYASPTPAVRRLFEDLGATGHFPGEPWIPERSRIWHFHTIDPRWNARVEAGDDVRADLVAADYLPRYFLLNGQSGYFAMHDPATAPRGRIGQPHLIRLVNTGMVAHSPHIHGNHVFAVAQNGVVLPDARFIDTWSVGPMETVDWLHPFIRPPDIAGPEDRPLREVVAQELAYRDDDYGIRQSPLAYPMHCHNEPSQTAGGGNYPGGLVTHWELTGDLDGVDFPTA